jgi:hypothetical protein
VVRSAGAAAVDGGVREVGPHVDGRDVKPAGTRKNRIAARVSVWKWRRTGNNRVGRRGIPKNCADLSLGAGPREGVPTRMAPAEAATAQPVISRMAAVRVLTARAITVGTVVSRIAMAQVVTAGAVVSRRATARMVTAGAVSRQRCVDGVGDSVGSVGDGIACRDRWRGTSGRPAIVASSERPEYMQKSSSGSGADKAGTSIRNPSGGSVGNQQVAVATGRSIDAGGAVTNTEVGPREGCSQVVKSRGEGANFPPRRFTTRLRSLSKQRRLVRYCAPSIEHECQGGVTRTQRQSQLCDRRTADWLSWLRESGSLPDRQ